MTTTRKTRMKKIAPRPEVSTVDTLLEITKRDLKVYGQDVVEQRAVPDYRDGLKPVHRFILWSCYNLGLKYGTPFKKAARTVGDVIGKYHPHGDQSTYSAMVGIAGVMSEDGKAWSTKNINVPLVEGYGNWGDNVDNAAAMRYTEARLSEFSTKYLLDPVYLAVSDYLPNFSGDDKVPLVLPAKLPIILLNGSVSIAFGVSAECPSFAPAGVLELVRRCLSGETLTPKLCTQQLVFAPAYGGQCVSEDKLKFQFHKFGQGSLHFLPDMEFDEKKRSVYVTSSCPGLTSAASWATLKDKLAVAKDVKSVYDASDKSGFRFEIVAERAVNFDAFCDYVEDTLLRRQSYNIGITKRELTNVEFERTNTSLLITEWCAWRVALESKVIKHLLSIEEAKLARLQLMLLAVNNLKIVIESLSKEDSAAYLVLKLKITLESANTILDMKVRQLKSLERIKLTEQIKAVQKEIATLKATLKNPTKRVLDGLSSIQV